MKGEYKNILLEIFGVLGFSDSEKQEALQTFKKKLAFEIVRQLTNQDTARKAQGQFEKLFQKGESSESIPTINVKEPNIELADFLVENNLAPSKSEAKRLIREGAIEIDGQTVNESEIILENNQVMRVGKKKFIRIKVL